MKNILLILLCLPMIGLGQTSWTSCDSSFSININSQDSIEVVYSVLGPNLNMNSNFSWVYFNMLGQCIGGSNSVASHIDTLNNLNINNIGDSTAIMCLMTDSLSSCIVTDTLVYNSLLGWSLLSAHFSTTKTYVPDDNFEFFLENNNLGDGILYNDSVFTYNIDTITNLNVDYLNINDLTGIQDFISLEYLRCKGNNLNSLNVSDNLYLLDLNCDNNSLTNLNLSSNTFLFDLDCDDNQIMSLDLSNNQALTSFDCKRNMLTEIDVSNNILLEKIDIKGNQINSLDLTNNINLYEIECDSNNLTFLDVENGNNQLINTFSTLGNINLNCINVDDSIYSSNNWINIDLQHYFSNNCSVTSIEENASRKEILKVIDLLGRNTEGTKSQPLFYIYDDGSLEKKLIIE